MSIPKERWAKFQQELVPIVFLSTIQVWWCFNFPAFIRLGNPLSTIVSLVSSIISVLLYFFIFSSPDSYTPYSKLEYLDEIPMPHRQIFKNIIRASFVISFHIGIFFAWYKNIYGMSNIHYAFAYANCVIAFTLIARAANKSKNYEI